jgi:ABC-type multidrug transport system ATPase subunit
MRISKITKSYSGLQVLNFPGREVERGRIYAVIGANGSGKSTLAKIVAGIIPAYEKAKCIDGVSVGYMPQKNYAFRMSTMSNILLNGNDIERAKKLTKTLGIEHLHNKRGHLLSGGETARMALVRLMMKTYDLVILDEPTAAMDMESTLISEKLIKDYVNESRCALILVTHSLQQARRIADEVWYFHKGALLEAGLKEKVLDEPLEEETRQFLDFYGI